MEQRWMNGIFDERASKSKEDWQTTAKKQFLSDIGTKVSNFLGTIESAKRAAFIENVIKEVNKNGALIHWRLLTDHSTHFCQPVPSHQSKVKTFNKFQSFFPFFFLPDLKNRSLKKIPKWDRGTHNRLYQPSSRFQQCSHSLSNATNKKIDEEKKSNRYKITFQEMRMSKLPTKITFLAQY